MIFIFYLVSISHFRFCIISISIIVDVLADAHGPAFVCRPEDRSTSRSSPTIGSRAELGRPDLNSKSFYLLRPSSTLKIFKSLIFVMQVHEKKTSSR